MHPILRDAAKRPLLGVRPGIPPGKSTIWALANGTCAAIITRETPTRDHKRNARRTPEMSGTLKVRVDQEKCQGHARCKSLAPDLFELDEFGNAHEIGDGTVPKGLEDKAWLAQTNCPEIAIEVIEE
jgi:ferredoxin